MFKKKKKEADIKNKLNNEIGDMFKNIKNKNK